MWAGGGQHTNTCLLLFVHIHVLLYLYVCRVYSLLFAAALLFLPVRLLIHFLTFNLHFALIT